MPLRFARLVVFVGAIVAVVRPAGAGVTADQVRVAIQRGSAFLKSRQSKTKGNWPERAGYRGGLTALCTLALIESGEPVDSPAIRKALSYLRAVGEPRDTYSTAAQIMVFASAEPKADMHLILRNAQWLEQAQITQGDRAGAWTYFARPSRRTGGDNSNSQFALLGLHAAEEAGVSVSAETWQRALEYWRSCQRADGSFAYYKDVDNPNVPKAASTGSMTCAGIAALVIASGRVGEADARVVGNAIECCAQQQADTAVERGLQWLARHFSVQVNPGPASGTRIRTDFTLSGRYYYLYGLERVGRLTGRRFIGRHDWYREGAELLVGQQDPGDGSWRGFGHGEDNPLIATSFALLFLAKGRRPVVMAKLKHGYGNDWDRHRHGVHHLAGYVERRWRRKLTWQTIDVHAATVEDLLEAPVLFLSGSQALELSAEQKQNLKAYVNQGGFLLVEACCGAGDFDHDFRELMKELFPESRLRLLPPDHAIWYAEQQVNPKYMPPLYGIDACCRTSVVYCPKDLSCYWELYRARRRAGYPQTVQEQIGAAMAIGANVLAYATNRQLKDKLEPPRIARGGTRAAAADRSVLVIPKLLHTGGSDDAVNALANLLDVVKDEVGLPVTHDGRLLSPADVQLFDYPIAFIHGRRDFRFSAKERKTLATYLERGGFLFGDAICASRSFAQAFRREIRAALPNAEFVRLPPDHPIFTNEFRGYNLAAVTLRDPQVRTGSDPLKAKLVKIKPLLEGVQLDGRLVVVFSPYDISCAMENQASMECKGYIRADAARIGVNVILYALQQ